MLIKGAEIYQAGLNDLRIERGIITDIGSLFPRPGEPVVEACGGTLLPGLHDHHIHFLSYAASLASIDCSPASVIDADGLASLLLQQTSAPEWLRGFGYHESIAGDIDCHWLDRYCPHRPARIQHRTGRLWIFNSAGLAILDRAVKRQPTATALTTESFKTGRFYDADHALSALLGRQLPPVKQASETLASFGITGFSDMTPTNNQETFELFHRLILENLVLQNVLLARSSTAEFRDGTSPIPGPVKIHLHENRLPPLPELVHRIHSSHVAGTAVAIHCVTEIELLFSLAALEEAGAMAGDRVEHASVSPLHVLDRMQALGVTVVTQPHFVMEKGDSYLRDVDPTDHDSLYRCRTFIDRNIPLAGSSDAPFGTIDPWATMRAAVERRTSSGNALNLNEALNPEQALALYLGALETPGKARDISPGVTADLCLLKYPWAVTRTRLKSEDVQLVLNQGQPIYQK